MIITIEPRPPGRRPVIHLDGVPVPDQEGLVALRAERGLAARTLAEITERSRRTVERWYLPSSSRRVPLDVLIAAREWLARKEIRDDA